MTVSCADGPGSVSGVVATSGLNDPGGTQHPGQILAANLRATMPAKIPVRRRVVGRVRSAHVYGWHTEHEWVGMAKVGNSQGGAGRRPTGAGRAAVGAVKRSSGAADVGGAGTPSPELTAKLEPRKGPTKVPLNTRVLASTEARLNWLVNDRQSTVTNVVDVALQEFFDRYRVPPADHDGRITEQES